VFFFCYLTTLSVPHRSPSPEKGGCLCYWFFSLGVFNLSFFCFFSPLRGTIFCLFEISKLFFSPVGGKGFPFAFSLFLFFSIPVFRIYRSRKGGMTPLIFQKRYSFFTPLPMDSLESYKCVSSGVSPFPPFLFLGGLPVPYALTGTVPPLFKFYGHSETWKSWYPVLIVDIVRHSFLGARKFLCPISLSPQAWRFLGCRVRSQPSPFLSYQGGSLPHKARPKIGAYPRVRWWFRMHERKSTKICGKIQHVISIPARPPFSRCRVKKRLFISSWITCPPGG